MLLVKDNISIIKEMGYARYNTPMVIYIKVILKMISLMGEEIITIGIWIVLIGVNGKEANKMGKVFYNLGMDVK
jgi:hypothetical protein